MLVTAIRIALERKPGRKTVVVVAYSQRYADELRDKTAKVLAALGMPFERHGRRLIMEEIDSRIIFLSRSSEYVNQMGHTHMLHDNSVWEVPYKKEHHRKNLPSPTPLTS